MIEENIKQAVENYQCPGCVKGYNTECYKKADYGQGCGDHHAGTMVSSGTGLIRFFLGMPKGFNRLGRIEGTFQPRIWDKFDGTPYDMFNIATWKHLTKEGHTLVRGFQPRKNEPFIDIFLENCMDKINCLEISEDDINAMD
jgi:hypothetical protein